MILSVVLFIVFILINYILLVDQWRNEGYRRLLRQGKLKCQFHPIFPFFLFISTASTFYADYKFACGVTVSTWIVFLVIVIDDYLYYLKWKDVELTDIV